MTICPCCGMEVDTPDVLVDESSATIVKGDERTKLSEMEMQAFLYIWGAYPRSVTRIDLYNHLYWHRGEADEPDMKMTDMWVHKLRQKINAVGLTIVSERPGRIRIFKEGQENGSNSKTA